MKCSFGWIASPPIIHSDVQFFQASSNNQISLRVTQVSVVHFTLRYMHADVDSFDN